MSRGYSEKAHAATGLTDGSNLVYCVTYMYTYKQKEYLYKYVICAGAENPNPATGIFQNVPLRLLFKIYETEVSQNERTKLESSPNCPKREKGQETSLRNV